MRRYVELWAELLRLSVRRFPAQTLWLLAVKVVSVGLVAASALALREVVDAAVAADARSAIRAAFVAALVCGLMAYVDQVDIVLHFGLVERLGLLELQPGIDRDIAGLETLDHLEQTEFLDRITVVRGRAWDLAFGVWVAVDSIFNMARLAVLLVLLGVVNPWLLLLLGFAYVPLWFEQRGQRAVIAAETETAESFRLQRHLFDLAADAATSKEIRTAAAGPECARRQAAAWADVESTQFRARCRLAVWKLTGWLIFTLGFSAGLGLVATGALQGSGTVGDIVLAITVVANMRQALQNTVYRTAEAAGAGRLIEPFLWLRDYTEAERSNARGRQRPPEALLDGISIEHVGFTYPGTERPALQDVSVRLPAGSVIAVVGERGSGKSTLVKLLLKLYQPTSGAVRLDGLDLADVDTAAWRSRTSAAFQDFGRFRTRFAETIGLGDLPNIADPGRIDDAVRHADATGLVDRLPSGIETQLGRELGGVDLSEGQWQKTALARASMRPAPLLFVLDEPTASLDAPSEHAVFEAYIARARALAGRAGAIVVIVSHRFSTVTGADRIVVLDRGRVVQCGSHSALMRDPGRYAELYAIQAAAYTAT